MDEIHRVCLEQELQYYLIGGTLLGAIRHGGFIPWDDDMDIVMPRKDYERFINNVGHWLSPGFKLEWITTNPEYVYPFAKVSKQGTLFVDSPYTKHTGIFVDIFPLDTCSSYSAKIRHRKFAFKKLNAVMWHKLMKDCFPKYWFDWLPSKMMSYRFIHRLMRAVAKSSGTDCDEYYANYGSQYDIKKQTMPKEWFGQGKLANFEDREYLIPEHAEKILTSIFGLQYMKLPPEEKRRSHYPEKVIFSDGEIMEFAYEHKVSVNEQESV